MTKRCLAVYEEGVFRPLQPIVGLQEHGKVELTVRGGRMSKPFSALAGRWSAKEADRMTDVIEQEFERIDLREW